MPKITYEKVTRNKDSSFSVIDYYNPYFAAPLHIHPEYELILIEEGTGTMYVGNFTKPLEQGDLLLIGPNLTHLWLSSECYYKPDVSMLSHSVYCQFDERILPDSQHRIAEIKPILLFIARIFEGHSFSRGKTPGSTRTIPNADSSKRFRKMDELLYAPV